ncbi:lipoprotein insertase outer membrane protein LolB [Elongatibacter sediminis]|uniref:Outer-membrane lipoprotein LolB n=1 Tax=Elongatibacter sediminis TaxID=3119006 RepID=A0AAW9RDF0_9GAMM
MKRTLAFIVVLCALVTACSPVPRRTAEDPVRVEAYQQRLRLLTGVADWEVEGRLAITDGREGGSGALIWVQSGEAVSMSFRGTLGRGSWRLSATARHAELQTADGQVYQASDVGDLVRLHAGWEVPVDALSWWVRGLAADEAWESRELDEFGRLTRLQQSGWEVEFSRYRETGIAQVPARIFARRGDYAVKLVIRDWRLGPDAE